MSSINFVTQRDVILILRVPVLVALLAVVLAGCGSSRDEPTKITTGAPTAVRTTREATEARGDKMYQRAMAQFLKERNGITGVGFGPHHHVP